MTAAPRPPSRREARSFVGRIVRGWWIVAGFLAVGIGAIGIVVPGLPTTGFFVLAAWCFSRSSPRFEQWVLGLPKVGPLVRDYRAGLGMPRRAKVVAISMMVAAVGLSTYTLRERPWIAAIVVAAGVVGTYVVGWRVPTRERVVAATTPAPADTG